jgi:two-component system OmpR family response regulator
MTGGSTTRILLIEDDYDVAEGVQRILETHGYDVDMAFDGAEGLAQTLGAQHDLLILDLMLPSMNGFQICTKLREANAWMPIMMLTAKVGDWDQAESFDAGADDYLTKPFSMVVLLAHVRALLRRAHQIQARSLAVHGMVLDPVRHCCTYAGAEVHLSAREVEVLASLMACSPEIVSRSELVGRVWGTDFDGDPNIVDVYVGHLRNKFEEPFGRRFIDTVRGQGYRFRADVAPPRAQT